MTKIKLNKKVQEFPGTTSQTKFITIPKAIADSLGIKKGDYVNILLEKVEIKTYRCQRCEHQFTRDNGEDLDCPACDCHAVEEVF